MTLICPPERYNYTLQGSCIDPRRIGRPYRFIFSNGVAGPRPCNTHNAAIRIDVTTGKVTTWSRPNLIMAGPVTFLPRPGAAEADETDGVVLLDCITTAGGGLFVFLDALTFTEVARIALPHRHTCALQSTWVFCEPEAPSVVVKQEH